VDNVGGSGGHAGMLGSMSNVSPRTVRLRPHHPVLRRGPDAVQLGVLPGHAVEAAGLPPPLLALLLPLRGAWGLDELVARAVELGAEEAAARALLADLVAAGGLVDAAVERRAGQARARATVLLDGSGPLLVDVAAGLASAGVGTLAVLTECGEAAPAREAVLAEVRRLAPSARVLAGRPRRRPDLAVLTDAVAPDAERHRELAGRGVPQLVVRLSDGVGLVGPLVLPGRSACLRCLDLHRAARDPCWPLVAAGLAGLVGSASPATTRATAALGVEQALLALDGPADVEPPPTLDGVLELDLRRAGLRRRACPPHPACQCGAAHIGGGSGPPMPRRPAAGFARPDDPPPAHSPIACTNGGRQ
jgi:bacteriocin biosynthesis cyclodehydratase domain-containing protein